MRLVGVLIILFSLDVFAFESVRVRIATVSPNDIQIAGESLSLNGEIQSKKISNYFLESARINLLDIFGRQWKLERNSQMKLVDSQFLKIEGRKLRINNIKAPEKIVLWPNSNGLVDVIATMDLEKYLEGVLPHEMPAAWNSEALKAQAIAARSYAVSQISVRKNNPFHLDSTIKDQVYKYGDENLSAELKNKIQNVIRETSGQVLRDERGNILTAYYHADCGGRTEQAHSVWDNGVKNQTAIDTHCAVSKQDDWKIELSLKKIEQKLNFKNIVNVKPYFRSSSGRVQSIQVINSKSEKLILSGQEFREKVGYTRLKSTLFDIIKIKDQIIFKGKGYGHGVGLCQTGTKYFAEMGLNYKKILSHYFPEAKLSNL